jgi:hypothetical protein
MGAGGSTSTFSPSSTTGGAGGTGSAGGVTGSTGGCGAGGTGTAGPLATVRSKLSSTQAPAVSVARTVMVARPASPSAGVPEKVRLAASKLSQAGRVFVE